MNSASLAEVGDRLREVVDAVIATGTECVLTRDGESVVVIVPYDEYAALLETLDILSDEETMVAIREGETDLVAAPEGDFDEIPPSVPGRELLVWENDELRASLFRGLADAAEGQGRPLPWVTAVEDDDADPGVGDG